MFRFRGTAATYHSYTGYQLAKMKSQYQYLIPIFIYIISIGIYLHPLTTSPTPSISPKIKQRWNLIYNPTPQLDELHIMHIDQHDIRGGTSSSWIDAWHNDYWGRPLTSESSHKSWRPVSIWSFRFIKGGYIGQYIFAVVGKAIGSFIDGILKLLFTGSVATRDNDESSSSLNKDETLASELFVHRIVNVLIHTAIVQLIGTVSSLLFSGDKKDDINLHLYTKYISQLLFALHPLHVEAVVNVANRPHILALLFNATIVDPSVPLLAMAILAMAGLLTAETAIFQFPAIVLTMTGIRYREELKIMEIQRSRKSDDMKSTQQEVEQQQQSPLVKTFINLLPRYILLVLISVTYLIYRHYNDTLSIPDGLIRPAENPFYDMTAITRVINYSYILSIHIMKSLSIDLVGFSHEYGYDCIPKMKSFHDIRLILPVTLFCFIVVACVWSWYGMDTTQRSREGSKRVASVYEERIQRILLTLVFFSWIATLFPISGILKVGTFVADRIAVASSFGTCIFAGRLFAVWIAGVNNKKSTKAVNSLKKSYTKLLKIFILFCMCTFHLAKQTHKRSAEWMDSVPLFESSLKTCPRSIKSNLEMSKLYSGLVPHLLDLDKALSLISTAQSIDPEYCDVHQQYAHVYFQQSKYISFEEEMVQSLLCSFTMGQAMNNWNKYWKVVLNDGKNDAAKARYDMYMARIRAAVENDQDERRLEEEKKRQKKNGKVNDEL